MDILSRLIAFVIFIFLLPVFTMISVICLIFNGRPIFFEQTRVGYNYRLFKIIKFRTMRKNNGSLITELNDKRVTIIGNFLRKSKFDEIPQLLNIIKGDMRFIGPRPEVPEFFDENYFSFLKIIKPGISDYASIILRNEDKILKRIGGDNPYKRLLPVKIELANYYASKKSFMLDLKLVMITIFAIISTRISSRFLKLPKISKDLPNLKLFLDNYVFQHQ